MKKENYTFKWYKLTRGNESIVYSTALNFNDIYTFIQLLAMFYKLTAIYLSFTSNQTHSIYSPQGDVTPVYHPPSMVYIDCTTLVKI